MAKAKLQLTETLVRQFIERNRTKLESFVAPNYTLTVFPDGIVQLNLTVYADTTLIDELLEVVNDNG